MSKSKKTKKRQLSELQKQRNKIRGLIADGKSTKVYIPKHGAKSKAGDANKELQRAKDFQGALASALATSRQSLAGDQFDGFLTWVDSETSKQLKSIADIGPVNSDLNWSVLSTKTQPLQKEVLWLVTRLNVHKASIAKFVEKKRVLEELYWNGDWNNIRSLLSNMECELGKSIWLSEVKIALEQDFEGLEAQKAIVLKERRSRPRSFSAYISYLISIRNEPTTDIVRFGEEIAERNRRISDEDAPKSFIQYRLSGSGITSSEVAAEILRVAQGLTEIDQYETLIGVCQKLIFIRLPSDLVQQISTSLSLLEVAGDHRLIAVREALSPISAHSDDIELTQPYRFDSVKTALKLLKREPNSVEAAIYVASCLKTVKEEKQLPTQKWRWPALIRRMSAVLHFSSSYDSDLAALQKHAVNHSFISAAVCSFHRFRSEISVITEERDAHQRMALLYGTSPIYATNIQEYQQNRVLTLASESQFSGQKWRLVLQDLHALQAAIERNEHGTVISMVTKLHLKQGLPLSVLPLRSALSGVRWAQLRRHRGELSLPIALHLCWTATDSDVAASNLRYAYDEFLISRGVQSAAELPADSKDLDNAELVYFLKNVCTPGIIDMSQWINSSRAVEEERKRICSALCEIDPSNRSEHEAEIVQIVHSLSVQEGRSIVDSSRVHVDTNALRAWATRTLDTSFRRYESLVAAGVGVADDVDVVLRAMRSTTQIQAYLDIPENEADNLLVEMMLLLREKFLLDPQHGLDSYLSRRVRHHSMTGYLRGPVEEAMLITSRNAKTGRYIENSYWVDKLARNGSRVKVIRVFESFAEEFDKTVLNLKSELFHVTSTDRPRGLFNISITAPTVHLARSALKNDMSLDSFCAICFSLFWGGLDSSLKEAQSRLRKQTKQDLTASFSRLKSALKQVVPDRAHYDEISVVIPKASESVQREIDKMAEWFVRRELQQTSLIYSCDKVLEIAIASALASHRPFDPQIRKSIDCEYEIVSSDLVVVAEIILTILGNVKGHSDRKGRPGVDISVCHLKDDELLSIRVENEIGEQAQTASARNRVDQIRRQIEDDTYVDKIRREGGSGLIKLAGIVNQSSKGSLTFGFIGDTKFFTEVRLSFITNRTDA